VVLRKLVFVLEVAAVVARLLAWAALVLLALVLVVQLSCTRLVLGLLQLMHVLVLRLTLLPPP
jgi:hypothetical protein